MTHEQAVLLIGRLVVAVAEETKQTNWRAHGPTKKACREEAMAMVAVFVALTGEKPTEEEFTAMAGG